MEYNLSQNLGGDIRIPYINFRKITYKLLKSYLIQKMLAKLIFLLIDIQLDNIEKILR